MDSYIHFLTIAAALLVFAARMAEVATKRKVVAGARQETLTFNLFMLCGALMVFAGIAEAILAHRGWWWPGFVVGAICSVASFAVRRRAIAALGKFWSLHVEMREGHEFVQSGPFRHMRHPVYFSMILELLGLALLLSAWITFGVVMLIFIPTLLRRLQLEEAALVKQFGPAYEEYQRTTGAIFPWRSRST